MLNNIEIVRPQEIEKRSMQIIESEMDVSRINFFSAEELKVVKRCIHTSADFDYQYNLLFNNDAVKKALKLIRNGANIVTDTKMASAGINKAFLKKFGCELFCFVSDEDVIEEARKRELTRSCVSVEKAMRLKEADKKEIIMVVGNAPTALIRMYELIKEEKFSPSLIVGVPVGFVNVIESKELIKATHIPSIIAMGRKGGSNIAAAIINSLLYQI